MGIIPRVAVNQFSDDGVFVALRVCTRCRHFTPFAGSKNSVSMFEVRLNLGLIGKFVGRNMLLNSGEQRVLELGRSELFPHPSLDRVSHPHPLNVRGLKLAFAQQIDNPHSKVAGSTCVCLVTEGRKGRRIGHARAKQARVYKRSLDQAFVEGRQMFSGDSSSVWVALKQISKVVHRGSGRKGPTSSDSKVGHGGSVGLSRSVVHFE